MTLLLVFDQGLEGFLVPVHELARIKGPLLLFNDPFGDGDHPGVWLGFADPGEYLVRLADLGVGSDRIGEDAFVARLQG
ncbi:hypothetical protein D3C80_1803330 [compost metagenome]